MSTVGSFPGNSARYYGLQTKPSNPAFGTASLPIITYGSDSNYLWKSAETITITSTQAARIIVTPEIGAGNIPIGWIIDMRGGDQIARSLTVIELKSQENLTIQFLAGETDKTFRVGQTVDIALNIDRSKNMKAFIKTFIQATGTIIVDIISHNGSGTYPQPSTAQQWVISVAEDSLISGDYMLARVTNFEIPSVGGQPYYLTFQAYQSYGLGTYSKWTITPQWERSYNFIRNENFAAYDASIGPSDQPNPGASFGPLSGDTTVTNIVTSDTPLNKSGYTQVVARGATVVYEDEHEIQRPYLNRQITYKLKFFTATETVNISYDAMLNPTVIRDETYDESPVSFSHTFSDLDFIFNDQPGVKYFPGNQAIYSNGELVSAPSPGRYVNNNQTDGSSSYVSYRYAKTFGEFEDPTTIPPTPVILPVTEFYESKGYVGADQDTTPNPEWFYYLP
jgi:hypothetical protein